MNNAVEAAPIGTATPPTLAEKLAALVEWDQTYNFLRCGDDLVPGVHQFGMLPCEFPHVGTQ